MRINIIYYYYKIKNYGICRKLPIKQTNDFIWSGTNLSQPYYLAISRQLNSWPRNWAYI